MKKIYVVLSIMIFMIMFNPSIYAWDSQAIQDALSDEALLQIFKAVGVVVLVGGFLSLGGHAIGTVRDRIRDNLNGGGSPYDKEERRRAREERKRKLLSAKTKQNLFESGQNLIEAGIGTVYLTGLAAKKTYDWTKRKVIYIKERVVRWYGHKKEALGKVARFSVAPSISGAVDLKHTEMRQKQETKDAKARHRQENIDDLSRK